jgi:hypothetical protein
MAALILYLVVAAAILYIWHRRLQPIPRAAVLVLLLLPTLFTGRAIFTGRVYDASDYGYLMRPLMDYAGDLGVHVHNGVLSDTYTQMIPWQAAVRYAWSHHQWPLWNPFMLCGDILAGGMQAAPYDPLNVIGLLLPLDLSLTFEATMTFFMAAFFAFVFARSLGIRDDSALFAAAAFMLSSAMAFTIGWAPHTRSWSLLPLVLFAVSRVVREHRAGLLAIALTFLVLAGHPETMLHVVAIGTAWGLFEAASVWRRQSCRRAFKGVALACGAGVLTLLLTAIFLLPFVEAVKETEEWADRTFHGAEPPAVLWNLIAHRAATTFLPWWGGASWKYNLFEIWDTGAARVGSIVFVLALAGIFVTWRRGETKFFAILLLICLGAAFDAPPFAQMLHYLPLFNIAVNNRLAFGAALAASLLAGFAIDTWARRASIVVLVATVLFLLATGFAIPIQLQLHQNEHYLGAMIATELLPLIALIFLVRMRRTGAVVTVLFALMLLQRINEDGHIYPAMDRKTFFPRVPVLAAMRGDEPFRMTGLSDALVPNSSVVYHLDDVRGYEAMTFHRLAQTFPLWCTPQNVFFNRVDDLTKPFLSLLGVRYAITDVGQAPPDGWRIALDDRTTRLLESSRALPRVFAPREIRYGGGADQVLYEVSQANDYSAAGWVETDDPNQHVIVNGQPLVTTRRNGTEYSIDVTSPNASWLVLTECAWRGWRVYLDGHRIRTYFADVAFLGFYVPAGRHHLRAVYMPDTFVRGRAISFATLAALAIALVIRRSRRRGANRDTPLRSGRSE